MSDRTRSAGRRAPRAAVGRVLVHEVHLQDGDAVERVGRQQVDADDRRCPGAFLRTTWLQPPGRDAEVDHALDALQEAEALVELDQLVGGAASDSPRPWRASRRDR
jgi:signal recognition particle subunit SEC65